MILKRFRAYAFSRHPVVAQFQLKPAEINKYPIILKYNTIYYLIEPQGNDKIFKPSITKTTTVQRLKSI